MSATIKNILAKGRDVRIWQGISLVQMMIFSGIVLYGKLNPPAIPDVLVVYENGYYQGKLEDFSTANRLHHDQTEIAALCLFQRTPYGLEYIERMKELFVDEAYQEAQELVRAENLEFSQKELHQKLEIAEISTLHVRGNSVLTSLTGQLIRTGTFEGRSFTELLDLTLEMEFIRNPDIAANGYYPSIVTSFHIVTTPIHSN